MENRYSLHGFIIVEQDDRLSWIQHVGDFTETGEMMYLAGRAYIHSGYDLTLIGKTRTLEIDRELTSFGQVEEYLNSLPRWRKTRYYVKIADLKLFSLLECETGEPVFSERNPEILRSLFKQNPG
jgi:hypothetical protein